MSNLSQINSSAIMPVLFVPHGGGPMPLLGEPNHSELVAFLREIGTTLPRPRAILMVSAHWEEDIAAVSSGKVPSMIYDYYGFPPESYQFLYSAPGSPELAEQIVDLLASAGVPARLDAGRGFDHGTFVPLMLMYPRAEIPVVQLSLLNSLDPAAHIALGKAIAPLREQGVLIVGSGMSFHNMQAFFSGNAATPARSQAFDDWLVDTVVNPDLGSTEREARLVQWLDAPQARFCHPREEHLLPLHVCWGAAATTSAQQVFSGRFFSTHLSAFLWS